jgi:hypothetical protein
MSSVPGVVPGMVVASTRQWDVNNNHNQRRVILSVADVEKPGRWNPAFGAREEPTLIRKVEFAKTNVRSSGSSWVTLGPDDTLRGHRLVSMPDPHVDALTQCFDGIKTARHAYRGDPDVLDVGPLVRRALLVAEHPAEDVTLDQRAIRAIAERILTLSQLVEQSALVAGDSAGAGYAPLQPAQQAIEQLSEGVDDILARFDAVAARRPAQWGDGE